MVHDVMTSSPISYCVSAFNRTLLQACCGYLSEIVFIELRQRNRKQVQYLEKEVCELLLTSDIVLFKDAQPCEVCICTLFKIKNLLKFFARVS